MKKDNTSETNIDSTKIEIPSHVYDKLKSIIDKKISDKVLFEFLVISRSPNNNNNLRYKFFKNNKYKVQNNNGTPPIDEAKSKFFFAKYGEKNDADKEGTDIIINSFKKTIKKYPKPYYSKESKGGSFYILKWEDKIIVFEAFYPELYDDIYNVVGQ